MNGKRVCVVMPGYNAEGTLEKTWREIPMDVVDDVILVDDASSDRTMEVARRLGIHAVLHPKNRGYGGNQKTCYREALSRGADVVVMLHPDYQYTPRLVPALVWCVASGLYDISLGSRILGGGARKGGMPLYKYFFNRCLTLAENLLIGQKLSEYHTGFRCFSRKVLETLPLEENSDNFVFDNQMLVQAVDAGYGIAEVTCPTRYESESSSIRLLASLRYGAGVMKTALQFRLKRMHLAKPKFLSSTGRRIQP